MGKDIADDVIEFEASKKYWVYIKEQGIKQFIHTYQKNKTRSDPFKWGDEVEQKLVKISSKEKKVWLLLKADKVYGNIKKNRAALMKDFPNTNAVASTSTTTTTTATTINPTANKTNTTVTTTTFSSNIWDTLCCCCHWSNHRTGSSQKLLDNKKLVVESIIVEKSMSPQCQIPTPWYNFNPEGGSFQIEGTPGGPYNGSVQDLCMVEANMQQRCNIVNSLLDKDEKLLGITFFPTYGTEDFLYPPDLDEKMSFSKIIPDRAIFSNPRYKTMMKHAMSLRNGNMFIKIPLYQDKHTKETMLAKQNEQIARSKWSDENWDPCTEVVGDCLMLGGFQCCLQTTFQAATLSQALYLHDQAVVLGPILLALTAATPFFRGRITNVDARWKAASMSCDERSPFERGLVQDPHQKEQWAKGYTRKNIPKSRFSSNSFFISESKMCKEEFNDVDMPFDEISFNSLINAGVSQRLARHISSCFIRKPILVLNDVSEVDHSKNSDLFELINGTNWNTARLKPPIEGDIHNCGWRVEFRSMEVQLTQFENAAFAVFSCLLVQTICHYNLNLYLPISKVDKNMEIAHKINAITKEKFFFRKNINQGSEDDIGQLTMKEIFFGNDEKESSNFTGIFQKIDSYLDYLAPDNQSRKKIENYLTLIKLRITGDLLTMATWMRKFVLNHSEYKKKQNSIVTDEIAHDLVVRCCQIVEKQVIAPNLLGNCVHIDRMEGKHAE